jgi:glycosyltransferase involved in cell wall biosynthesis
MTRADATRRRLAHQRTTFLRLTEIAAAAAGGRRLEEAAAFAQLAARYASDNHPATFSSPALETLLAEVGAATMPPLQRAPGAGGGTGGPRRVLHVLTKAIGVGGHTRYALRWMEHDDGRVHSLALTGQTGQVPAALAEAVAAGGGELRVLGAGPDRSFLGRAAELREMAADADAVVLFTHPFDVVPVIALAGRDPRPLVLFVNHSDHCFWVGRAVADLVACIRQQGATLCIGRRGIAADRLAVLPVALARPDRRRSRDDAKKELGLPPSAVVLLTVAAPYKYEPIDEVDFLDLVTPAVQAHDDAVLLAVGPEGGRWREAAARTAGRIRALGPQQGIQRYYEACDVYLDPHPVSSVTSLLEAAALGNPAMTLCPYDGDGDGTDGGAVLCSEDPGLEGMETRAAKPGDYVALLDRLVGDAELRSRLGASTAAAIAAAHDVDRWRADVESIYARLEQVGPVDPALGTAPTGPGEPGRVDEVLCRILGQPVLRPGLFADVYRERDHLPRWLMALGWPNLAIDEAGRKLLPRAGLGRERRETMFLRAAR